MFDNNIPITRVTGRPVLAGERTHSSGQSFRPAVDIRGRVLHVRRGRQRSRRYSPVAYGGINRRHPNDQRRGLRNTDHVGDRVVTLLVPAGTKLDSLIGREISLIIAN